MFIVSQNNLDDKAGWLLLRWVGNSQGRWWNQISSWNWGTGTFMVRWT